MEIWKDIVDYEGVYEISNYGNVRRKNKTKNRKFSKHNCGYNVIILSKDNEQKGFHVHRLVANSFIANTDNKPCINHKDGNKKNNHVGNLEWVTYSENAIHAYDNNLYYQGFQKGSSHFNSKINDKLAKEIFDLTVNKVFTQKEIGAIYEISHAVVSDIKNKRLWKHIH